MPSGFLGGGMGPRAIGGGGITWLLRDEFVTNLAATTVNGTAAEPGPGTRTVVDAESKLSILSGALTFAGGKASPANGDPGLWLSAATRAAGRMVVINFNATNSGQGYAGWHSAQSGATLHGMFSWVGTVFDVRPQGQTITASSISLSQSYSTAAILRASGTFYFIKGGAFSSWTFLWMDAVSTTTPLYPCVINYNSIFTSSYIRVPDRLWLPTPLISDGFASAFGTSDGLGHAEGIAGGIGAGGGGVAWTQQVGTWEVASGKAKAATLDGGIAIATAPATTANVVIGAACVRSGGDVGIVLNYADASNYVRALHNGTNVQLIKTVAGTPTTLINTAATYSAGARLVVTKDGTAYRVYYNNALIGTEQTIADAGIISNTLHGLFSTDASNTLDDFVVYARGNEGQYAALDAYSFD